MITRNGAVVNIAPLKRAKIECTAEQRFATTNDGSDVDFFASAMQILFPASVRIATLLSELLKVASAKKLLEKSILLSGQVERENRTGQFATCIGPVSKKD